jgi:hypothetical protein
VTEGLDKLGGPLDETVAANVAGIVAHLEAEDFADGATPAATGLDQPAIALTAVTKDGATKTLLLGKEEGQSRYAKLKDGDRIWKIHKYEADRVPSSPAQWRDKTIVKLEPAEVVKIDLVKDKDHVVFERGADKTFKATTPTDLGEIDQSRVTGMLNGLTALRATRVVEGVDAKAAGLDKPRGVATFTKRDGSTVKITFGAAAANEHTVQVSGVKDLYALSDYQAQAFLKAPADFKKKPPAPPGPPRGGM